MVICFLRRLLLFVLLLFTASLASVPVDLAAEEMTISEASAAADRAVDRAKAAQLEAANGEAAVKTATDAAEAEASKAKAAATQIEEDGQKSSKLMEELKETTEQVVANNPGQ